MEESGPATSDHLQARRNHWEDADGKSDSLKVDIKTQPGERDSENVAIYMPLFWTLSPESLLKFVTILDKIIRVQYLSTGPQKFGMMQKLVVREAL